MELGIKIPNGYKKSKVGIIPQEWVVQNILDNSILKARIGWQGLTTKEYLNFGNYRLITGTDFYKGRIDWDNCWFVEKERYDQDRNIQIKNEDILITKDGTIGKVAYVEGMNKPATLNSGIFVVRPKNNEYLPKFLFYIFISSYFEEFLRKLQAGSTISHLYQKDFIGFDFTVPPILEQQSIVEALSDIDELIMLLEESIEKKKLIKQGAMQELLTEQKRLSNYDDVWEEKSIGEIAKVYRGASPRPINNPKWFDSRSKVGWVRISDVTASRKYLVYTAQKLSQEGILCSRFIEPNNLIMSICATVGYPVITNIPVCIHDGLVVFDSLKVDIEYMYYQLQFKENQWLKYGQIGSQMNLNTNIINGELIFVPPDLQEQKDIAGVLSDMDNEIDQLENRLSKYKKLKIGMMQDLLTGRIRLNNSSELKANKVIKFETTKDTHFSKVAEESSEYKGHNDSFNEAVILSVITDKFGSEKYPLGSFRRQKLTYLFLRKIKESTEGYMKKAMGPYDHKLKYRIEKIAEKNGYIKKSSFGKGRAYTSDYNIGQAKAYFDKWYRKDILEWLEKFRYFKNNELEVLTTVDMAILELKKDNQNVSIVSVKEIINSNKEWKPKLKKTFFNDFALKTAIDKCKILFR